MSEVHLISSLLHESVQAFPSLHVENEGQSASDWAPTVTSRIVRTLTITSAKTQTGLPRTMLATTINTSRTASELCFYTAL